METKIAEIAQRIRGLREVLNISIEEIAQKTNVTAEQFKAYESGECDFGFTFLYLCAKAFNVDIVELLTGEEPRLSFYTIVRKGTGLPINRRKSFSYKHLAYRLQNKLAEPFLVTAPYLEEAQSQPIELSRHSGQEFNYILEGTLKVQLDDHIEILHEGDSIFYNSGNGHGMIAIDGKDCTFIAVVIGDFDSEENR